MGGIDCNPHSFLCWFVNTWECCGEKQRFWPQPTDLSAENDPRGNLWFQGPNVQIQKNISGVCLIIAHTKLTFGHIFVQHCPLAKNFWCFHLVFPVSDRSNINEVKQQLHSYSGSVGYHHHLFSKICPKLWELWGLNEAPLLRQLVIFHYSKSWALCPFIFTMLLLHYLHVNQWKEATTNSELDKCSAANCPQI